LLLLTLFLKGDWTLNPPEALQANPTLFVERDALPKAVFAFLGSLDLFSFWTIFLLALGFGRASRTRTGPAAWGVIVPWLLVVLGKVGLAAAFG
jgi:hypothetical protein